MEEKIKWSKDGKCPYCGSSDVRWISGHGIGAREDSTLPPLESNTYLCLNPKCGKKFKYHK